MPLVNKIILLQHYAILCTAKGGTYIFFTVTDILRSVTVANFNYINHVLQK